MLGYVISGATGGFLVLVVQAAVLYYALKKEAKRNAEKKAMLLEEAKKWEEEIQNSIKKKEELITQNQFNKGDFLKSKEFQLQPWETKAPDSLEAEVLEVGNGAYLMEIKIPGYQGQQLTIPFLDAHSAFVKDVTKRAKVKLTVIPNEEVK